MFLRILRPLKPLYSEGGALLKVGNTSAHYPDVVAGLEGFARPLWGLAPYFHGGGAEADFAALYAKGLANGTNPDSPDYWDAAGDIGQRYVEMAAISLGLLLASDITWSPLPDAAKSRLAAWLNQINTIDKAAYPDCNWWFFIVLTNLALEKLGQPHSRDMSEYALARMESFYIGGGWYTDGTGLRKDYYVSFAIHFYSLLYAVLSDDAERARVFTERAEAFARDFLYWFDDKGRAVPYGRSLTYRFAQSAFWGAYVYAGLTAVPLDVVKGILTRHLSEWMSRPIFDRDGVLTIGYHYPNLIMAETYNAPGSPYWALKPFILLALSDEHPFWQAEAAPMPTLEPLKAFPEAGMLIQRRAGHVVMYPSAVYRNDAFAHVPEKYGKFAYSSEFGFSVANGGGHLALAAPDSMLAFEIDGHIFTRRTAVSSEITDGAIVSRWSPVAGVEVETVLTPTANGHTRRHTVTNRLAACTAYDCGFAVPAPCPGGYTSHTEGGSASVTHAGATCAVASDGGEGLIINAAPNTNLMVTKTAIPAIQYAIPPGKTVLQTEVRDGRA